MQSNRDLVSSLLKSLSLPRSVTVAITRDSAPDPNFPLVPIPPLTLRYKALTYHELAKNVVCEPIRAALDAEDRMGSITALKAHRDSPLILGQCGYD